MIHTSLRWQLQQDTDFIAKLLDCMKKKKVEEEEEEEEVEEEVEEEEEEEVEEDVCQTRLK